MFSNNFSDFYVTLILSIIVAFILLLMTPIANAAQDSDEPFAESYQMQLLYHPSTADVQMEQQGRVNIYVGLTDKQVEGVLDSQFERIDAMMFASIVRTDNGGEPVRDPITGEVEVEEDGCD